MSKTLKFPQKWLELVSEFSKVARYKVNTQRTVVFLSTNHEQSANEITKTIPFTIASRRIKYGEINLAKQVEDLYSENYKC